MSEILCVIDGMTDPGFRADNYHNLSRMRLKKYIQTVPNGYEAESLTCILTLLEISPIPMNIRAYVEALGAGIPVGKNDLVFRGSWVSIDNSGNCSSLTYAPNIIRRETDSIEYHSLGRYKSIILLKDMADKLKNVETHAPYRCLGQPVETLLPDGIPELTQFIKHCSTKKRILIPWGQGRSVVIPPYQKKTTVICGTDIVRGIAKILGMEIIIVTGATGDTDTDLTAKALAALRAAEDSPFVFLHINGADEAAHRRDAKTKMAFLQNVDKNVLALLIKSDHIIRVVSDHGTNPENGIHIGEKQPMYEKIKI
ncbi:MAG: hypothetical protein RRY79_07240 [Clostridia bacterium]